MYVYSLDGKKPTYFWAEESKITFREKLKYILEGKKLEYFWSGSSEPSFKTYKLGDNWYYLYLSVR